MASTSPTPRASRGPGECAIPSGTNGAMKVGSGWEPITLSTAILSGSGVSSTSGLASRLSRNSPPKCGQ
jgi:hypothetical protein